MSAETSRSPDTLPLPSTVVFDAMTQPISVFDDDGRYRYINRAGLELLGMTAEAVLGRRYLELFPELAAHPFNRAFMKVAARESSFEHLEFRYEPMGVWSSQAIHRAEAFVFALQRLDDTLESIDDGFFCSIRSGVSCASIDSTKRSQVWLGRTLWSAR